MMIMMMGVFVDVTCVFVTRELTFHCTIVTRTSLYVNLLPLIFVLHNQKIHIKLDRVFVNLFVNAHVVICALATNNRQLAVYCSQWWRYTRARQVK